jgi:hypothetical protein
MSYDIKQTQPQERGKLLALLSIVVTLLMCSSAYSQQVVTNEPLRNSGLG